MFRLQPRQLLLIAGWALLAAVPVVYIVGHIVATSRNIVFWDEFDTALDLILELHAGIDGREIFQRLFAITNEHRTVMSRLLFAVSYWLTGTVNFHVVGAIGNLFFFGLCAALVLAVSGWERRVRMAVVLAFLLCQLEHFESFIWSGASIDHFQVVTHSILAIVLLARGGWRATAGAMVFAVLATFTLAQGNVAWVVGALLLAFGQRWRELGAWCIVASLAVAAFLHGFELNPGHAIDEPNAKNLLHVARYWLTLLGAPLTLGETRWAPLLGIVLLAGYVFFAGRGLARRQPAAWFAGLYGIGALSLVALGRAELAGTLVNSRYLVLGALAWSMLVFLGLELAQEKQPARPFRYLLSALPGLVAFNVVANARFAPLIDSFVEVRDRAATSFEQFGMDGKGVGGVRLHPRDQHADILLKMAEDRGVYRLPEFSRPVKFPANARPGPTMITHVDELFANDRAVTIGGWAMLPGIASRRGEIFVVLKSASRQLLFSTVPLQRSDVAAAYHEPRWRYCGFRAVIRRGRLPQEDFTAGVVLMKDGGPQVIMTPNRLDLSGTEARAIRSPGAP